MRTTRLSSTCRALALVVAALAAPVAGANSIFWAMAGEITDESALAARASTSVEDAYGGWADVSAAANAQYAGGQLVLGAYVDDFVISPISYSVRCGYQTCTVASADTVTYDGVRITPTALAPLGTAVTVRFDVSLDGSIVGNGGWSLSASGQAIGGDLVPAASYSASGAAGSYNLAVNQVMSFTKTFVVGADYLLSTSLSIDAYMGGFSSPWPHAINMDFRDALTIQGVVLSTGVGPLEMVSTSSGRDYLLAPVPLPAAAWAFCGGLGALGWIRRRQAAA